MRIKLLWPIKYRPFDWLLVISVFTSPVSGYNVVADQCIWPHDALWWCDAMCVQVHGLARPGFLGSTWRLQLRTILTVLIPDQVPIGILLLAGRILQLCSEGDGRAIQSWTVTGQTDFGFTCREVDFPGEWPEIPKQMFQRWKKKPTQKTNYPPLWCIKSFNCMFSGG